MSVNWLAAGLQDFRQICAKMWFILQRFSLKHSFFGNFKILWRNAKYSAHNCGSNSGQIACGSQKIWRCFVRTVPRRKVSISIFLRWGFFYTVYIVFCFISVYCSWYMYNTLHNRIPRIWLFKEEKKPRPYPKLNILSHL